MHRLCPSFFQAKSKILIRFPPLDSGKRHTLLPFLREELAQDTRFRRRSWITDNPQSAIRHPLTAGCIRLRFQHIQRSLASWSWKNPAYRLLSRWIMAVATLGRRQKSFDLELRPKVGAETKARVTRVRQTWGNFILVPVVLSPILSTTRNRSLQFPLLPLPS